jgi:7-cyano-7-deazaguanine synthase in queuosine biosynthesis
MMALMPERLLRAVEGASRGANNFAASSTDCVVVIGRDIRTSPERIAKFYIAAHEPIYEDLATLVESMAYLDRLVVRRRADGWGRQLSIQLPVYEHSQFQRGAAAEALKDAAGFLTGDRWCFEFVARKKRLPNRQSNLPLQHAAISHVVPFSDGLDSFAQARFSVREHGKDTVLLVRSGLGRDRIFPDLLSVRVPRKFSRVRLRETSYRTRPLVFYTVAAIAAVVSKADAVVIGENGQGALGPACLPFGGEWWVRSAHPGFVKRWANFLGIILEKSIRFEQPQLWKTKGEVLSNLRNQSLTRGWEQTSSCATRPNGRYGHRGCGYCGGCLLRRVSAHAAGLASPAGETAFDVYASADTVCDRDGKERRMTPGERAVAVRAIAAMSEFARLADSPEGKATVYREGLLIDPRNPNGTLERFLGLLHRHRAEWDVFVDSLPNRSWAAEMVSQL